MPMSANASADMASFAGIGRKTADLCPGSLPSLAAALGDEAGEQGTGASGQWHYAPLLIELRCPAQVFFCLVERPGQQPHLRRRHQELGHMVGGCRN